MSTRQAVLTTAYHPADTSEELLDITLGTLLRQGAAEVPDRLALVEGTADAATRRRWTYAELLTAAERIARGLLERFRPGDRLAIYAANSAEWILLQHATSLAGILAVPLNPAFKAHEVETILLGSGAVGVVHDAEYRGNDLDAIVRGMLETVPALHTALPIGDVDGLGAGIDPDTPLPAVTPDDTLQIQYTSGTTGVPKGALLHHRGVVNTSRYVALRAGFPEGGVWVNAMPMFHIGGSAVTAIGCLALRGTYVLAPGFDPGAMLELLESERGNASLLVPTMIIALLDHPDFRTRDLSTVRTILSGAAAVPAALVHRVKRDVGCDVSILFGQTEINGVCCQTGLDDAVEDQSGTLGRPLPHAEVAIVDPVDGTTVMPIGEPGEICIRGYQNMTGYHGMPEATKATFSDGGWLRMGDLGTMDERGYLRIAGRLKEVIIRGGMNLYPREIEDVIFDHPEVSQVCVVGVPDEKWGETVAAIVVPRDPAAPPEPEHLNAHCRERLASHKSPLRWYFVDEYPLTPTGKVQKFRISQWIDERRIEPHPWTPNG